jgi:hypothetical protein
VVDADLQSVERMLVICREAGIPTDLVEDEEDEEHACALLSFLILRASKELSRF